MCYTPNPLRTLSNGGLTDDDFMSPPAKPLWGPGGRDDLGTIKKLGANVVRMYGNNQLQEHKGFLDRAKSLGLSVIPGMSNYPYIQQEGSCKHTGFDCSEQLKFTYAGNLRRGFLLPNRTYDPVLAHVIVINEPDNILQWNSSIKAIDDPYNFSKGVISAVDGMLDAEREAGVQGPLINFTVVTTFSRCPACTQRPELGDKPGIRQMLELQNAFMNPEQYGYKPTNNLTEFYWTRFIHSFNTQSAAWAIENEFLPTYQELWPHTPFYIEEFHVADIDPTYEQTQAQTNELWDVMKLLKKTDLLLGWNFFEFQESLTKDVIWEHQFGMFTLGNYTLETVYMFGMMVNVSCLVEANWRGVAMSKLVTEVWGGAGIDLNSSCVPDPMKVKINSDGYQTVCGMQDLGAMTIFVNRLIEHLGGNTLYTNGLRDFAAEYSGPQAGSPDDFDRMVAELLKHPRWAAWSEFPTCVTDHSSNTASVGWAIHQLCEKMPMFSCKNIPLNCKENTWNIGDYVFSVYAREAQITAPVRNQPNPLDICYFDGSAIYAAPSLYEYTDSRDPNCVVTGDPETTPLTQEGWQAVMWERDIDKTASFIARYTDVVLKANITDDAALAQMAHPERPPPQSLVALKEELRTSLWVCGGEARRSFCNWTSGDLLMHVILSKTWMTYPLIALLSLFLVFCVATCVYARITPDEAEEWRKNNASYRRRLRTQHLEFLAERSRSSNLALKAAAAAQQGGSVRQASVVAQAAASSQNPQGVLAPQPQLQYDSARQMQYAAARAPLVQRPGP